MQITEFTFGNHATVSLNEATRRQAVDILKGLAERLDVVTEPSREVDAEIDAIFFGGFPSHVCHDRTRRSYEDGYIHNADDGSNLTQGGRKAQFYTNSIDASLELVTSLYPSLVIVMCRCSDGTIEIREAWDAEDDSVEVNAALGGHGGLPVLRCLVAAMIKRVEVLS